MVRTTIPVARPRVDYPASKRRGARRLEWAA
jgi:hypothetical protein